MYRVRVHIHIKVPSARPGIVCASKSGGGARRDGKWEEKYVTKCRVFVEHPSFQNKEGADAIMR
jgi:hypothetical protein